MMYKMLQISKMHSWTLLCLLLTVYQVNGQQHFVCNKINSCSCKGSAGTIDMSPLDSKDFANPK